MEGIKLVVKKKIVLYLDNPMVQMAGFYFEASIFSFFFFNFFAKSVAQHSILPL